METENRKFKYGDFIYIKVFCLNFYKKGQVFDFDENKKLYRVCFFENYDEPNISFYWSYVNEEDMELFYKVDNAYINKKPLFKKDLILNDSNFKELYKADYYVYRLYYENRINIDEFRQLMSCYIDNICNAQKQGLINKLYEINILKH